MLLAIFKKNRSKTLRFALVAGFSTDSKKIILAEMWNFCLRRHGLYFGDKSIHDVRWIFYEIESEWRIFLVDDGTIKAPETCKRYRFIDVSASFVWGTVLNVNLSDDVFDRPEKQMRLHGTWKRKENTLNRNVDLYDRNHRWPSSSIHPQFN